MSARRTLGSDAAEAWLKANDPNYKQSRKLWESKSTDALAQQTVPFEFESETTDDDGNEQFSCGDEGKRPATSLYDSANYDREPRGRPRKTTGPRAIARRHGISYRAARALCKERAS